MIITYLSNPIYKLLRSEKSKTLIAAERGIKKIFQEKLGMKNTHIGVSIFDKFIKKVL